jgi:hypothetical protein
LKKSVFHFIEIIGPILKPVVEKPAEVAEGRQEIYDCWVEGIKCRPSVDKVALLDAVYGASQLGFNSTQSSLISACVSGPFKHFPA